MPADREPSRLAAATTANGRTSSCHLPVQPGALRAGTARGPIAKLNRMPTPYQKLTQRAKEIALVTSANELLSWDLETYLPAKGVAFRAEQLAHLCGHTHRLFIAKKVGDWIKACEDHGFAPESDEAANVREWRRRYDRATKIPSSLVENFQRVRTHAREA